jgi:hypothetical protein
MNGERTMLISSWLERGDMNDVMGLKEALNQFETDNRR